MAGMGKMAKAPKEMGIYMGKQSTYVNDTLSGWWCNNHLEKYDFVSWDDEIPNIWKNNLG
jgi:hypothetical protein